MSYGVFQEYYSESRFLKGNPSLTGIVGTTFNGVIYISMPFLFAAFTQRWARFRRLVSLCGVALTALSYLLSSWSTNVSHVVVTQGVLASLGGTLIYSPTTLSLGEWWETSNRAVAYGIVLSSKNVTGSVCPFILRALLDRYGFGLTMRIWAAIVAGCSLAAIFLIPTQHHPFSIAPSERRSRQTPWHFLKHRAFYIWSVAILLQSVGYGIPQTYLTTYARSSASLSQTSATLLLTFFNLPGILSSSFFGYLSDNKHHPFTATTTTLISALSSTLSVFLLWGLASPASGSRSSMPLLTLFAIIFGFFAGGYSATWGGIVNEMEREARDRNEAIDSGVLYGLLNGARGLGYVSGGLASVPLLKAGSKGTVGGFAYETEYMPLIVFTGLSSLFGAWSVLWKGRKLLGRHVLSGNCCV
ncbi:hypothetical protein H2203_004232 [Taxawa tesnikishii (nom. ined.)]|nr:hypothetical protein H2203_004232 [Dothideales sp. JES 119]